jgi:hypothetical protein
MSVTCSRCWHFLSLSVSFTISLLSIDCSSFSLIHLKCTCFMDSLEHAIDRSGPTGRFNMIILSWTKQIFMHYVPFFFFIVKSHLSIVFIRQYWYKLLSNTVLSTVYLCQGNRMTPTHVHNGQTIERLELRSYRSISSFDKQDEQSNLTGFVVFFRTDVNVVVLSTNEWQWRKQLVVDIHHMRGRWSMTSFVSIEYSIFICHRPLIRRIQRWLSLFFVCR